MRLLWPGIPVIMLVAGGTLHSTELPSFGVQAALVGPINNWAPGYPELDPLGFQFGGHARWDFREGHGLVIRADYTLYGNVDETNNTSLSAGVDYTYHLSREQLGSYVIAGVSYMNYNLKYTYPLAQLWDSKQTWNGLGYDLGAGYDFNRQMGLQARYRRYNLYRLGEDVTLEELNLGITYTF